MGPKSAAFNPVKIARRISAMKSALQPSRTDYARYYLAYPLNEPVGIPDGVVRILHTAMAKK